MECACTRPVVSQPIDMGRVWRALITDSTCWVWPASKITNVHGEVVQDVYAKLAERLALRDNAVCGSRVVVSVAAGHDVGGDGRDKVNVQLTCPAGTPLRTN